MSKKQPIFKFAETIPTGTIALICGIGALSTLFPNLIVACLLGATGFLLGVLVLKMETQRLEKIFASVGIILSTIPWVYALISLAWK